MQSAPRPSLAVPVVLLLASTAWSQSSDCLDQDYVPNPATNGLEVTANQPVTQTFTVGRDGQLTRVDVALINHHRGTPTAPLQVDLVTTDPNGTPTTTALASLTFMPSAVPASRGALSIDLTPFNLTVQSGQVLGLALSTTAAPGGATYAWWGEAPGGSYHRGQVFIRGTTPLDAWDVAFRTYTSAPASATNYGAGHPGTNGVPVLAASAAPILGTTPDLLVGNSLGTATGGALLAGFARAAQPTPFGGTLLVQIVVSTTLMLPAGGAPVPMPIPQDTSLCGGIVDFQCVVVDPGASHGIAFTPGLEFVLGM